ncbi:MAG: polysaccharide deacetylase family protein [Brevinematales bacterium]
MITGFFISNIAAALSILILILVYLFSHSYALLLYGIIAVIAIHQGLYIYGMFGTRTNFFFKTLKGKEYFNGRPEVLLRFDDGPDPVYTPRILDILKSGGRRALFAVTGASAEKYPGILLRIRDENHVICNHTYSHPFNILLSGYKRVYEEISRTNLIIEGITGVKPSYYCPTIGHKNHIIGKVIKKLGLVPVMWDIRTLDTQYPAVKIINRIKRGLKPPSIIMFHDGIQPWSRSDREETITALKETIRILDERRL